MEYNEAPKIKEYHQQLHKHGIKAPVLEVDAREKNDIETLIKTLLYSLDPWLGK